MDVRRRLLETLGAGTIFVCQANIGPWAATETERMFECLSEGGLIGKAIADTLGVGQANRTRRSADLAKNMHTYATRDNGGGSYLH